MQTNLVPKIMLQNIVIILRQLNYRKNSFIVLVPEPEKEMKMPKKEMLSTKTPEGEEEEFAEFEPRFRKIFNLIHVAPLAEWRLLTPEDTHSNRVIGNFIRTFF